MRPRRTHPALCLVALAAYLLNLAAVAGGAVLCQDPVSEPSIEFATEHDHCAATFDIQHDSGSAGCWCTSCPCEDTPLALDVTLLLREDEVRRSTTPAITIAVMQRCETQKWIANRIPLALRPDPKSDRSLRQLRTVVQIV